MTNPRRTLALLGAIALMALSGCAGTAKTVTEDATSTRPTQSKAELEALYWARQDSAMSRFTQADIDFMVGMIGHHAQALIMSNMAPSHGANKSVQILASRIINAQKDEIGLMQKWLRERGQTVPEVHIEGTKLMVHGGGDHSHHNMPGMLSPQQIDDLNAARDDDFDRLFLSLMIQHHAGAVVMVDELFASDGAAQDEAAFKLAADIHVDQITEIERMKSMLQQLVLDSLEDN